MSSADSAYARFPAIHGDRIVFVCEDDLWAVPAAGGRAERLTTGTSPPGHPSICPDGRLLAFIGTDDGPEEVYVMPAAGGPARRLTYDGANATVVGWHDGAIVYASNVSRPFQRDYRLWCIDPAEGLARELGFGAARTVSYGPGGAVVLGRHNGGDITLGRHNREPAMAKRYRGGTAGTFWVDAAGAGEFVELAGPEGNLASPCWIGQRIYFLSDHQGVGNVYSCLPDGGDLRRHTDHEEFYARNLASDGQRLVYHCAGELYLLDPEVLDPAGGGSAGGDPAGGGPERVPVALPSPRAGRVRKFVTAANELGGVRLGPDGSDLALTSRGKAFTAAHWEGPVRGHGEPDGVRYRQLAWLPDHRRLVAVAGDESPDEHLVVLAAHGPAAGGPAAGGPAAGGPAAGGPAADGPAQARTLDLDIGRAAELAVNPRSDQVAIANHRHEILLVDLTAEPATVRTLDHTAAFTRPGDLAWSPDGQWLAYSRPQHPASAAIVVANVATGERKHVTRPVLMDTKPSWDPTGRYLYFLG